MKFLALALILNFSAVSFAKECDSEKIIKSACEHFKKNKHQQFIKLKDGTQYRNPLFEGKVENQDLPRPTKPQKERLKRIFDQAKEGLRKKIMNGVPEKNLSAERKNLLKRIENVGLLDPEDRPRDVGMRCSEDPYNAYYVHQNHSLSICDGYYQYPEESLIFILGHEIGHSIDPCKSKSSLYKVSHEYLDQKSQADEGSFEKWDQYFIENDYIYMSAVGPYKNLFSSQKDENKSGVELIAGAFTDQNHPFANVQSCLINEKKFRNTPPKKQDPEDCSEDQINELMGDVYGSWAFADKAGGYESSDSLFALIGTAHPDVCDPKATVQKTIYSSVDYPSTYNRFSRVILQSSELRQAFQCAPEQDEPCLNSAIGKKPAQSTSSSHNKR